MREHNLRDITQNQLELSSVGSVLIEFDLKCLKMRWNNIPPLVAHSRKVWYILLLFRNQNALQTLFHDNDVLLFTILILQHW